MAGAVTLVQRFTPDTVVSFRIRPGTLAQFLGSLDESGPKLTCLEGSVTLVSPGRSHELMAKSAPSAIACR